MLISLKRTAKATLLGLGLMGFASNQADAGVIVSYEAAGVQASTMSGVITETFDELKPGSFSSIKTLGGTLSGLPSFEVVKADEFGGAGGTGNYFAVGAQSGTTAAALSFQLTNPQTYFGFWFSAIDSRNSVELLSAGNVVETLSAATVDSSLSSAYNGNPNSGADSGEKFAFVNFTATGDTTFDQIRFMNASTATGFEADNFTIKGTSVPEPSSIVMASIGGLIAAGSWVRTRRRAGVNA